MATDCLCRNGHKK